MKVAVIALLLVVLVANHSCHADNLFNRLSGSLLNETLVYAEHVEATGIWLIEREVDVVYPPKVKTYYLQFRHYINSRILVTQNVINNRWITSIRAIDANTKGNGANVTVIAGGINRKNVHLRFRSQRGHSIDFNVQIFTGPCYNPW